MSEEIPLTAEQIAAGEVTDAQRRELGRKKRLWHIEVICHVSVIGKKDDKMKWERSNLTRRELDNYREFIFAHGLLLPLTSSAFVLIPPRDIGTIYCDLQAKFFE